MPHYIFFSLTHPPLFFLHVAYRMRSLRGHVLEGLDLLPEIIKKGKMVRINRFPREGVCKKASGLFFQAAL